MAHVHSNLDKYNWKPPIESPERLRKVRTDSMGQGGGRYVAAELPEIPFADSSFDIIALSSHFLFLYGEAFSAEFHVRSICEMLRVASEARIFPLMTLDSAHSPLLGPVSEKLESIGMTCRTMTVPIRVPARREPDAHSQERAGWLSFC